jgi:hypothetical protein
MDGGATSVFGFILTRAARAYAIEQHRVLFDSKLRRRQLAEIIEASGDVEHAIALLALEVVMVPFVRTLVPRWFAGNLHRVDPAVIEECTDRPIDGRDP